MGQYFALPRLPCERLNLCPVLSAPPEAKIEAPHGQLRLSTEQKISLFKRLFRGRQDIFPVRWQSKASGKAGYSPACANEWLAGVCEKPRIKCADCSNRQSVQLSDEVFYDHLAGEQTIGV